MNSKSKRRGAGAAPKNHPCTAEIRKSPFPHLVVKADGVDGPFKVVHALTSLVRNSKGNSLSIASVWFHTLDIAGERHFDLIIRATAPERAVLEAVREAVRNGRLFDSGERLDEFHPDAVLERIAQHPEEGWPVNFRLNGFDRPGLVRLIALEVARGRGTIDALDGCATRGSGPSRAMFTLDGSCLCESEAAAEAVAERLRGLGGAAAAFTVDAYTRPPLQRHAA